MADEQGCEKKNGHYNSTGAFIVPRILLLDDLSRFPYAFTLFIHLIGWANRKDNQVCKRGETPIGAKDVAERLRWGSVNTVTKSVKVLKDRSKIITRTVRTGNKRGTIVTVLDFDRYDSFFPPSPRSFNEIGTPSPRSLNEIGTPSPRSLNEIGTPSPRSFNEIGSPSRDHDVIPLDPSTNVDLLLLLNVPYLETYFRQLPHGKAKREWKEYLELAKKFEPEKIAKAVQYLRTYKIQKKGEVQVVNYPLCYLATHMDSILLQLSALETVQVQVVQAKEPDPTIEELRAIIAKEEQKNNPEFVRPLRRLLEKKLAEMNHSGVN